MPGRRALAAAGAYIATLLIAGTLVLELAGRIPMDRILYDPWTNIAGVAAYAALVSGTLWAARVADGARGLGLRLPERPARAFGLAAIVLVVGLAAAAALEPLLHGARSQGLTPRAFPGGPQASIGLALTAVVIVGIAPFAEELFFRGALTGALAQRLGAFTPLATGAIFGAAHLEVRAFPALFVLGALLGWLYMRTRSLLPGMAVHAANNLLALLAALLAH